MNKGCAFLLFCLIGSLCSCVSSGKLKESVKNYNDLNHTYQELQTRYQGVVADLNDLKNANSECQDKNATLQNKISDLNKQVDYLKQNNEQVLDQLKSLSVVTGAQAESIKKSLETNGLKDVYIRDIKNRISQLDSATLALNVSLRVFSNGLDSADVQINCDKWIVSLNLSDRILFDGKNFDVTDQGKTLLLKIAQIVGTFNKYRIVVEGHTDDVPYRNGILIDNWDLSTKRATAVTRILVSSGINPQRIQAAGQSEFVLIGDNATAEGRLANRRTRILLIPDLSDLYQSVEKKTNF